VCSHIIRARFNVDLTDSRESEVEEDLAVRGRKKKERKKKKEKKTRKYVSLRSKLIARRGTFAARSTRLIRLSVQPRGDFSSCTSHSTVVI